MSSPPLAFKPSVPPYIKHQTKTTKHSHGTCTPPFPPPLLKDLDADHLGGNLTWQLPEDLEYVSSCRGFKKTVDFLGGGNSNILFIFIPVWGNNFNWVEIAN